MQITKTKSLPNTLTRDQLEALQQVSDMQKGAKPSACVARNAKHLSGTKYIVARRDGTYQLADKGAEALFTNNCTNGLREWAHALDQNLPVPKLTNDVMQFLERKSYIVADEKATSRVTDKGRECLADIAAHAG